MSLAPAGMKIVLIDEDAKAEYSIRINLECDSNETDESD
jgi:hypothetical protein